MKIITRLTNAIGQQCKAKNYSLVIAESCTGGGIAYAITSNCNSSTLLERGYVTYSLIAKTEVLGVSDYVLQTHGAVSVEIAMDQRNYLVK